MRCRRRADCGRVLASVGGLITRVIRAKKVVVAIVRRVNAAARDAEVYRAEQPVVAVRGGAGLRAGDAVQSDEKKGRYPNRARPPPKSF